MAVRHLEGAPNHATFGASHAADEHAGVVLDVLRNKHARFRGAVGVRAGHGLSKARGARVAKLLDGAPCAEAGVAGFALSTTGVVPCVLVEWHSVREVGTTHDIATATAVVLAEVPCEICLADSTCFGRLIGLEENDVSV